jgi:hypothetical protein
VITIIGELLTPMGHNQRLDDNGLHTRAWAAPAANARHQQPSTIPLNVEHQRENPIGEVVALHNHGGSLLAICEADADPLLDADMPIYYSAETTMRPDYTDVLIEGVALCERPAAVCLQPVEMYAGSVSEAIFRSSFGRDNYWRKEILEQALETRYKRLSGAAICINYPPPVEQRHGEYETHGTYRRPGAVFHRPGRIIAVR